MGKVLLKIKLILIVPLILIILLNGCAKKDGGNPVGPESQDISGLWQTEGIAVLGSSNAAFSMNFQNGVLTWDIKFYSKSYSSNQFILEEESSSTYNFTVDNSFIKIDPPQGNTYDHDPLFYHYSISSNKLSLDAGSIYTGNSNNLTETEWNLSDAKYKYNLDKTGVVIYGASDSVYFTYRIDGNTIIYSYDNNGRSTTYTGIFEIKNNKFYIYEKPGVVQSNPRTHTSQSIILSRTTSSESLAKDYFPLKIGNSWTFDYGYSPSKSYGSIYTSGTLSWTIISFKDIGDIEEYTIRETFKGKTYSPASRLKDTVYIGPDTAYFNITESPLHRITINSKLTQLGQISIKRFYAESTPDTISVSTINYTSHNLTLIKAEGVKIWTFGGRSNSDLFGSLRLNRAVFADY